MTISAAWVAVSTTPVLLADGGNNGLHVKLYNAGGPAVYLGGGTTVAGTSGFAVGSAVSFSVELEQAETLYAVAASGTATVQVFQGGGA